MTTPNDELIVLQCVSCARIHEVEPLAVVTCPCGRRVLSDRAMALVMALPSDLPQLGAGR